MTYLLEVSQTVFHFDSDFQPDPLRIVFGKKYNAHTGGLFQSSGITKVENIFERDSLLMTFKYQNRSLPKAIFELFSGEASYDGARTVYHM